MFVGNYTNTGTTADLYNLLFCVVIVLVAVMARKMFRNMFTNLRGGKKNG